MRDEGIYNQNILHINMKIITELKNIIIKCFKMHVTDIAHITH